MFNKLKTKLKLNLIHWLEIDNLNSNLISVSKDFKKYKNQIAIDLSSKFEAFSEDIDDLNLNIKALDKRINNKFISLDDKYDSLHRTIQSCVKMGADIQQLGGYKGGTGSWAVVCFRRGNNDIVKFIDLDCQGRDGREMFNYLKQFDASRYAIDSPFSCGLHRDLFYMWDKEED